MTISGTFIAAAGQLTATGDNLTNTITLSRDPAGTILINGGNVPIVGGTRTVANTATIQAVWSAPAAMEGYEPAKGLFGPLGSRLLPELDMPLMRSAILSSDNCNADSVITKPTSNIGSLDFQPQSEGLAAGRATASDAASREIDDGHNSSNDNPAIPF